MEAVFSLKKNIPFPVEHLQTFQSSDFVPDRSPVSLVGNQGVERSLISKHFSLKNAIYSCLLLPFDLSPLANHDVRMLDTLL